MVNGNVESWLSVTKSKVFAGAFLLSRLDTHLKRQIFLSSFKRVIFKGVLCYDWKLATPPKSLELSCVKGIYLRDCV